MLVHSHPSPLDFRWRNGNGIQNFPAVGCKQAVQIVNEPSGAGIIAATNVLAAKPDGYTLGFMANSIMVIKPHTVQTTYKSTDDYRVVLNAAQSVPMLTVRADAQWKTLKEFVAYAKANPGKLNMSGGSLLSTLYLGAEVMKQKAGIDVGVIAFAGDGEAIPQLLGGHIHAMMAGISAVAGMAKSGQVRLLGIASDKRDPNFPDVPTFREEGLDMTAPALYFVIAPKATPDAVVKTLHDNFKKAMEADTFKKAAQGSGFDIVYKNEAEMKKDLTEQYTTFGDLIKRLNLGGKK